MDTAQYLVSELLNIHISNMSGPSFSLKHRWIYQLTRIKYKIDFI